VTDVEGLPDIRVFLPRFVRGCLVLVCVGIFVCLVGGFFEWAVGIALGALIFAANLVLFARDLIRVQERVEEEVLDDDSQPAVGFKGTKSGLRLILVALALAIILWYMPARPEGIVIGVCLVLVAAAIAARSSAS